MSYTQDEMMTVTAARSLRDGMTCLVGIGLPSEAANLARATHAPRLVLIYAAQLDRHGNINTTMIGSDYARPAVRLPGAGGGPEIAAACKEVIVVLRQSRRTFTERVDFVTSVGFGDGPGSRKQLGLTGGGPLHVITDLGVLRPDPASFELVLTGIYPGVPVAHVRAQTGWEIQPPTPLELAALRALRATRPAMASAAPSPAQPVAKGAS